MKFKKKVKKVNFNLEKKLPGYRDGLWISTVNMSSKL